MINTKNNNMIQARDKLINSRCVCKKGHNWIDEELVLLDPCEHILHRNCFKNKIECPMCNKKVTQHYTEDELAILMKHDSKYYQKYVDILSMRNINDLSKKDMVRLSFNTPRIMDLAARLPFTQGFLSGWNLAKDALTLSRVKVTIRGKENLISDPKIIILNHTCPLDFIVAYYIFKCSFVASESLKESWVGQKISEIVPLLLVNRGKQGNTVEKMKEYLKTNKSLCIFPEGMCCHPDTIMRFRSGAFHVGVPINPVVLSFDDVISDTNIPEFFQKMFSQESVNVKVSILPAEYPPFNDVKIEAIRKKMAKAGDMALSRVSNRDIKD